MLKEAFDKIIDLIKDINSKVDANKAYSTETIGKLMGLIEDQNKLIIQLSKDLSAMQVSVRNIDINTIYNN